MFQIKKVLFFALIFSSLFFLEYFISFSEGSKERVIGIIMSAEEAENKYSSDIRDSVIFQIRNLNQKLESKNKSP